MTRVGLMLQFCIASLVALGLFQLKDKVAGLEDRLRAEREVIAEHQEAIQILQAEWSYLNRPGHIADLAERHLELTPVTTDRIVTFETFSERLAPREAKGRTAEARRRPGMPTQLPTHASARNAP